MRSNQDLLYPDEPSLSQISAAVGRRDARSPLAAEQADRRSGSSQSDRLRGGVWSVMNLKGHGRRPPTLNGAGGRISAHERRRGHAML
jgi:hypothetical protein